MTDAVIPTPLDRLADCPQVTHFAEVTRLVGDGTWLSTTEAADIIGVSDWQVRRWVDDGTLPATRVGNRRRILRTVAEAYRDKMRREAGQQ